jgi:predicted membrane protein
MQIQKNTAKEETDMKKKSSIKYVLFGLFFIIVGASIICKALGVIPEIDNIAMLNILLALMMVPVFVEGIIHVIFSFIFFPIAIELIIFRVPLGLEAITPWPVLGAALFLSLGCSLLVPRNIKWMKRQWNGDTLMDRYEGGENWTDENMPDGMSDLKMNTRFAGSSKYINSEDFRNCEISCSFGGTKVYFDKAVIQGNSATINLNAEFSGVDLYIPKEWPVKNLLRCKMGGVEEKGERTAAKSGKFVVLTGDTSFSGVTVIYC